MPIPGSLSGLTGIFPLFYDERTDLNGNVTCYPAAQFPGEPKGDNVGVRIEYAPGADVQTFELGVKDAQGNVRSQLNQVRGKIIAGTATAQEIIDAAASMTADTNAKLWTRFKRQDTDSGEQFWRVYARFDFTAGAANGGLYPLRWGLTFSNSGPVPA